MALPEKISDAHLALLDSPTASVAESREALLAMLNAVNQLIDLLGTDGGIATLDFNRKLTDAQNIVSGFIDTAGASVSGAINLYPDPGNSFVQFSTFESHLAVNKTLSIYGFHVGQGGTVDLADQIWGTSVINFRRRHGQLPQLIYWNSILYPQTVGEVADTIFSGGDSQNFVGFIYADEPPPGSIPVPTVFGLYSTFVWFEFRGNRGPTGPRGTTGNPGQAAHDHDSGGGGNAPDNR